MLVWLEMKTMEDVSLAQAKDGVGTRTPARSLEGAVHRPGPVVLAVD
jgi:hypothetical protein